MLDKQVTFMNIIMKMDAENVGKVGIPELPEGFDFRLYQAKDAAHWSRIETSVLEFDTQTEALNFFQQAYIPYEDYLKKRCLFITNSQGLPIATANAWYVNSELGDQAVLHWVAVCPEYQGLGLGRAIVQKALTLFQILEPKQSVWLHTQTWSHSAVKLYHSLGFRIVKEGTLANRNTRNGHFKIYPNNFPEYIEILKSVMQPALVEELLRTAI